jgi:hypothetical protein
VYITFDYAGIWVSYNKKQRKYVLNMTDDDDDHLHHRHHHQQSRMKSLGLFGLGVRHQLATK